MNLAKNHDLTEFSFHQINLVHSGQQMLTKVALVKNVVTQHHTAARRVVASLSCFAYHTMLRLLPNRGLVGSQGLKRTIKNMPNVDACAEIHFQMKISRLERLSLINFFIGKTIKMSKNMTPWLLELSHDLVCFP